MIDEIFTRDEFVYTVDRMSGRDYTTSALSESRSYSNAPYGSKTIFLSHSHLDADLVLRARKFFENIGVSIYVDWADNSMPQITSGETAAKIKEKIRGNRFFVFLATDNSVKSMWCNWEVGYGDSYKFSESKINNKMLILPLASNRVYWKGNEYLQLYPYVVRKREGYCQQITKFYVCFPDRTEMSLAGWLNS